jgi:glycosyltransferase involved in cell wall biosynthesis
MPFPVTNGRRAKSYSMLAALSGIHTCYVLAFGNKGEDLTRCTSEKSLSKVIFVDVLPRVGRVKTAIRKAWNLAQGVPPSFASYRNRQFVEKAREVINRCAIDAICYDMVNMAQFIDDLPALPSVHTPNDATSRNYFLLLGEQRSLWRRVYMRLSARFLRFYETRNYHRFSRIHVGSRESADYLTGLDPRLATALRVIPLSVGPGFFQELSPVIGANAGKTTRQLLSSGNISNPGVLNGLLDFLDTGWEKVAQAFPGLRFVILTGGYLPPALEFYKQRFSGMEIIPWVEDYRDVLVQSDIFIAPDRTGPGPKTRIMQALAAGIPVVALKAALEGIPYENGIHLYECESAEEMGQRVVELLASEEKRSNMSANARRRGQSLYASEVVARQWVELFEGLS